MIVCPKCHKSIENEAATFCPKCGANIREEYLKQIEAERIKKEEMEKAAAERAAIAANNTARNIAGNTANNTGVSKDFSVNETIVNNNVNTKTDNTVRKKYKTLGFNSGSAVKKTIAIIYYVLMILQALMLLSEDGLGLALYSVAVMYAPIFTIDRIRNGANYEASGCLSKVVKFTI